MNAGDYVICIDDKNWSNEVHLHFDTLPVKNHVYRIRRVIPNIEIKNGPAGLALEGIFGAWDIFETYEGSNVYEEYHFRKNRFRVVDITDLKNVVHEILKKRGAKEVHLKSLNINKVDDDRVYFGIWKHYGSLSMSLEYIFKHNNTIDLK